MARAPCESETATSVGKRSQSVMNRFFIGVGNLLGWMQIFMPWSVDILSETMRTLWRETSFCTSLWAVHVLRSAVIYLDSLTLSSISTAATKMRHFLPSNALLRCRLHGGPYGHAPNS